MRHWESKGYKPDGSDVFILKNLIEMLYNNFFVTSCILLIFFRKCFAHIEINGFTYLETISKKEELNVYRNISLSRRRNHNLKMVCCAACGISAECIGVDVCGESLCRLWNGIFDESMTTNTSNDTCRWYIKNSRKANYTEYQSTVSTIADKSQTTHHKTMATVETTAVNEDSSTTMDVATTTGYFELSSTANESPATKTTRTAEIIATSVNLQTTGHVETTSASNDVPMTTVSDALDSTTENSPPTDVPITTRRIVSESTFKTENVPTTVESFVLSSTTHESSTTDSASTTAGSTTHESSTTDSASTTAGSTTHESSTTHSASTTTESTTHESSTTDSASTTTGSIMFSSTTDVYSTNNDLTTKVESTSDESTVTENSSTITGSFAMSSTTDEYLTIDDAASNTDDVASTTPPVVTIFSTDEASTASSDIVAIVPFEFSNGSVKDVVVYNESDFLWIIIQRRFDGSVDFYRNWSDYEAGFGSIQSEFWLGNQYIHQLTVQGYTILRIELTNFDGELREIEYDFSIENETNNYRLHITEISTSGIDSLARSDLAFFCTFDKDNDDRPSTNCADLSEKASGWWHSKRAWCTDGNLNGIYTNAYENNAQGIHWFEWDGHWTLKETRMMLRKP